MSNVQYCGKSYTEPLAEIEAPLMLVHSYVMSTYSYSYVCGSDPWLEPYQSPDRSIDFKNRTLLKLFEGVPELFQGICLLIPHAVLFLRFAVVNYENGSRIVTSFHGVPDMLNRIVLSILVGRFVDETIK